MESSIFEVVRTTTGALSIRNKVVNEIMHNPVGPWVEANSLYIEQSSLRERLLEDNPRPLVVFDVGLGAAANALAALHCLRALPHSRNLHLISFERDLDLLHFALQSAEHFEHFHGYEHAIRELLANGLWEDDRVRWELRAGDFVQLIANEGLIADVVFYDPYSPQVNSDMWTLDCFRDLRARCSENCVLMTYSKATPIRTALLCANFYVGAGRGTGEKDETTMAATRVEILPAPFAARWFERWQKSCAPFPLQTREEERALITERVVNHPQFKGLSK